MTIDKIADEFQEHGELLNSLRLIEDGQILLDIMERYECNLEDVIEGIRRACLLQVEYDKFRIK